LPDGATVDVVNPDVSAPGFTTSPGANAPSLEDRHFSENPDRGHATGAEGDDRGRDSTQGK
jgi:hypothetical protein